MKKLEIIESRVLEISKLKNLLAVWRFKSQKIVFTNGCFDILHLGHIDYLSKAKDLGDILIIGVNSDNSIRRIKGTNRPITDEMSRATILAALHFVDAVVMFEEDTPYNLIEIIKPDILVKGGDYKPEEIVGADIVVKNDGKIEVIPFLEGYSTSKIIDKIKGS
ncbi:MAG: D-glycero-beta-D-manno-heptose 1-phosphate adenylyltransferase [Bacteroidales bacterium]|nr:D-glycero-beta-D-manno-heptose 1-phosphate adenylyltransferase [Bacteroidales bacterium]